MFKVQCLKFNVLGSMTFYSSAKADGNWSDDHKYQLPLVLTNKVNALNYSTLAKYSTLDSHYYKNTKNTEDFPDY